MASCTIKIGKFKVSQEQKSEALKAAEGIKDFDVAVIKSYQVVKDVIPLGAWEKYLRTQWDMIPRRRDINEKDLGNDTEQATELKDLLNLDKLSFENKKGAVKTGLSMEAEKAISLWKKHLLARKDPLSNKEVQKILNSLKALVKMSKRESKLDQMRNAAKRKIRKGYLKQFPALNKVMSYTVNAIKGYRGDDRAQIMEDYREILETFSVRDNVQVIPSDVIKSLTEKANNINQSLGTKSEPITVDFDDPKIKSDLIEKVLSLKINPMALVLKNERDKAKEITSITEEDLQALNNRELLALSRGIESINEGRLQHPTTIVLKKIKDNKLKNIQKDVFNNTEKTDILNFWSRGYGQIAQLFSSSGVNNYAMLFRSRSGVYSGTIVGDKHNRLYRDVTRRIELAEESVTAEKNGLYDRAAIVDGKIGEFNRVEKSFTPTILSLLDLHETNENIPFTAEQYIESFIKHGRKASDVNKHTVAVMEKLQKKYVGKDGKLNRAKLEKAVKGDKGMKALYEYNKENNIDLVDKVIHVTATERGEAIPILNNNTPIQILFDPTKGQQHDPTQDFANAINPVGQKGKKKSAKSSVVATTNALSEMKEAPVIEFDLFTASTRNSAEIITDFYLTPELTSAYDTVEQTYNELVDEGASEITLAAAEGWKQHIQAEIEGFVSNHSENDPFITQMIQQLIKASYVSKLVRAEKFVSEAGGNVAYWVIEAPADWGRGLKSDALYRADIDQIYANIGSGVQAKLGKKSIWAGKGVDASWTEGGGTRSLARAGRFDKITEAASAAAKLAEKPRDALASVAKTALAGPDKWASRPGHFGKLENEFENRTGIKLTKKEYDLISFNDETFMDKYGEDLRASMILADEQVVRAASTSNKFTTAARFKKIATDSTATALMKSSAGYFMNFSVNEGAAWKYYVRGLAGREEISRGKAARGLAAVLVRMAAYRPMMTAFGMMLGYIGLSGGDDEEDTWKDVATEFRRDLIGSFLTLSLQGTQSSHVRYLWASVIEDVNKKHLGFLRDGEEYVGYKHAMQFSLFKDKERYGTSSADILIRLAGPGGAIAQDVDPAFQAYQRGDYETMMEELMLFASAYSGYNPAYRDMVTRMRKNKRADKNAAKAYKKALKQPRGGRPKINRSSKNRGKRTFKKRG